MHGPADPQSSEKRGVPWNTKMRNTDWPLLEMCPPMEPPLDPPLFSAPSVLACFQFFMKLTVCILFSMHVVEGCVVCVPIILWGYTQNLNCGNIMGVLHPWFPHHCERYCDSISLLCVILCTYYSHKGPAQLQLLLIKILICKCRASKVSRKSAFC